jgi:molecular chaperone HscB
MTQHLAQNHFELFGLPVQFAIDLDTLDQHYRKIQAEVHPDRFVSNTSAERLRSMQLATQANEAYQTLKNPTARARYLLRINDIDTQEESNTAMPADFLMLQMEWREAIEEAEATKDIAALDGLLRQMRQESRQLHDALHIALDVQNQHHEAADIVRKLSFIDKMRNDIEHTIAKLED